MASEILCSYRFLMEYWQACSSRCQKERKIYGGKTLNTEHCIHYLDFFLCIGKRAAGLSLSKRTPCSTLRILCFLSAEFEVSGMMWGSEPSESVSLGWGGRGLAYPQVISMCSQEWEPTRRFLVTLEFWFSLWNPSVSNILWSDPSPAGPVSWPCLSGMELHWLRI